MSSRASSSSSSSEYVLLISSDGVRVNVSKELVESWFDNVALTIVEFRTKIKHNILHHIINFVNGLVEGMNHHQVTEYVKNFYESRQVDVKDMGDYIAGGQNLGAATFLELTYQYIASTIRGLTAEQVREKFNIVNDMTDQDIDEVKTRNYWAFL